MRSMETGRKNGEATLQSSIVNCWRCACQRSQRRTPFETTKGAKTIVPNATIKAASEINNRRFFGIRAHCFNGKSFARKAASEIILLLYGGRFDLRRICENKLEPLARSDSFYIFAVRFLVRFFRQISLQIMVHPPFR